MAKTIMAQKTVFEKHQWTMTDQWQVVTVIKKDGKLVPKILGNLTKISTRLGTGPSKKAGNTKRPYFSLALSFKKDTANYKLWPNLFMAGIKYDNTINKRREVTRPNDRFIEYVALIIKGEKRSGRLTGVSCDQIFAMC